MKNSLCGLIGKANICPPDLLPSLSLRRVGKVGALTLFFLTAARETVANTQGTDFSLESATAIHRQLAVDIGPRPMGSPAEQRALHYAAEKFRQYGCDTVYIMRMSRTSRANTSSGIAVGIKRGAAKRIILIGGHIDSAGPEIPGADDNASGSAVVIELARVYGKHSMQSTLVFACFGGEEQGLEGSRYFVNHFPEIDSVALMLNIDMANGLGILDVDGDAQGISAPKWLVCAAFDEARKLNYHNLRYPTHFFTINYLGRGGSGSDHESFLQTGIPAIDFTTDVNRPIHTPQDGINNFDPRGLKRSGDIVARLIERFDTGVPNKELSRYWLYVVGHVKIFGPYWVIDLFLILTVACAVLTFIIVRKKRIFPLDIRWSGWKMFLCTTVVVAVTWFSWDVVGLLKGVRYPWISELSLYYGLAAISATLGVWLALAVTNRLPLSHCPYVYFKRAGIILLILTILSRWANSELAMYPASALFLLSLAMVVKRKTLKVLFVVLSPLWMARLIFSEWDHLLFRSVASTGISLTTFIQSLFYNVGMILFFSVYAYPLFLGFVAVYRDAKIPVWVSRFYRSRGVAVSLAVFTLLSVIYISSQGSYSNLWQRTVYVEYKYPNSLNAPSFILLRSNEYLDGIVIKRPSGDTLLAGRINEVRIPVPESDLTQQGALTDRCTTYWKTQKVERIDDTTTYELSARTFCNVRPYMFTVTYSSTKDFINFSSPSVLAMDRKSKVLKWYSYPDTVDFSVRFSIVGNNSPDSENPDGQAGVRERMEWVFDRIVPTWEFEAERTNFIQRTYLYAEATLTDSVLKARSSLKRSIKP
jgi:hypothetical protein